MTKAEVMAQKLRAFKCRDIVAASIKSPPVTCLVARNGGRGRGVYFYLTEISEQIPGSVIVRKRDLEHIKTKITVDREPGAWSKWMKYVGDQT